ncbi:unnamed protein product [Rhizophagus irregularis]|uniref:Uncharacterized protein n=1 Tax=Rhizophagus irregularis TaxID=588596 RepID=A0A2I1H6C4_9GLOM|nr:hypothetical protein RhiirA4_473247 [Rhizophagus irregularis]CAB4420572.1 unnamed protein product [Rhizophagus irregularis]
MVYLAYFKNKDQLDVAIALDLDVDQTWIIHGKKYSGVMMAPLMEGPTILVLSSTNFNEGTSANQQKQTVITPATVNTIDTEEIVDTVNKFRKNLLDESPSQSVSTSI